MFVHWNGASWTVHTIYEYQWAVRDVSGTSPDDVWALVTYVGSALVEWDGQRWLNRGGFNPLPGTITACVGTEISALSRADLLIVGTGGCTARWQNGAWSDLPPNPAHEATGLWSGSASEAWISGGDAAGAPVVARWDGSGWTSVPTGSSASLHDIWSAGRGSTDVWAVGNAGTILRLRR
jgi:hypothetical protein